MDFGDKPYTNFSQLNGFNVTFKLIIQQMILLANDMENCKEVTRMQSVFVLAGSEMSH